MRRVVREQRQAARGCIQRSARIEISISRFIDFIVDKLRIAVRYKNHQSIQLYIYIYKIRRVQRVITLLRYCQMRLYIVEMSRRSFLIRFRLRAIEQGIFDFRGETEFLVSEENLKNQLQRN